MLNIKKLRVDVKIDVERCAMLACLIPGFLGEFLPLIACKSLEKVEILKPWGNLLLEK